MRKDYSSQLNLFKYFIKRINILLISIANFYFICFPFGRETAQNRWKPKLKKKNYLFVEIYIKQQLGPDQSIKMSSPPVILRKDAEA